MRTTLTLDDDVATMLKCTAVLRGKTFRAVVNEALRRGYTSPIAPALASASIFAAS